MPHDGPDHGDHHHHHEDDAPHRHPQQPDLEDAPFTYHQVMAEALGELLVAKGVFSADDLRRQIELQDSRRPELGAQLIARAWTDPAFKLQLMADVNAAAASMDIAAGDIPIRAVENTPEIHNVVVCTLCSCYPRSLIGLPPDWYKSRAYRSRCVKEPRKVLAEFGTDLPDDVEVRVHDSTADLRYLVLPLRPAGTDGWSAEQLETLVTRDCMIGVTLPKTPA